MEALTVAIEREREFMRQPIEERLVRIVAEMFGLGDERPVRGFKSDWDGWPSDVLARALWLLDFKLVEIAEVLELSPSATAVRNARCGSWDEDALEVVERAQDEMRP